jgi:hypothetical protein
MYSFYSTFPISSIILKFKDKMLRCKYLDYTIKRPVNRKKKERKIRGRYK